MKYFALFCFCLFLCVGMFKNLNHSQSRVPASFESNHVDWNHPGESWSPTTTPQYFHNR